MWILVSLAAGTLQTVRNGLARSLSGQLPAVLLSWARFAFNLPFVTVLLLGLGLTGSFATLTGPFLAYCAIAGLSQLVANVALVTSFRMATFAQAIVIHKSEVALTAVAGALIFSEVPSLLGWLGVAATMVGVAMISLAGMAGSGGGGADDEGLDWRTMVRADRGSALALAAAALLVVAAFAIKEAIQDIEAANPTNDGIFGLATTTLFHVTWMEVAVLTGWILIRQPTQFRAVPAHWPRLAGIGFAGFAGSLAWFWAFSLTLVAYVRAVGQIEAVLSVLLALYLWREEKARRQIPGILVTMFGILLIVLG